MALANLTSRPAFLLLGLTDGTDVHPLLFLLFLGVYLVSALGNLSMVALVRSDRALRSPMSPLSSGRPLAEGPVQKPLLHVLSLWEGET